MPQQSLKMPASESPEVVKEDDLGGFGGGTVIRADRDLHLHTCGKSEENPSERFTGGKRLQPWRSLAWR